MKQEVSHVEEFKKSDSEDEVKVRHVEVNKFRHEEKIKISDHDVKVNVPHEVESKKKDEHDWDKKGKNSYSTHDKVNNNINFNKDVQK